MAIEVAVWGMAIEVAVWGHEFTVKVKDRDCGGSLDDADGFSFIYFKVYGGVDTDTAKSAK